MNAPDFRGPGFFQPGSRRGTVGHPLPGVSVRVTEPESGKLLPADTEGMVLVKGPNVMKGYLGRDDLTAASIRDGWYVTGDLGMLDEDGFLRTGDVAIRDDKGKYWIVDRKKELIKVKGFQVAPAELEAVLLENEHVADAAVVALQGDHEELPRAYISLKDASKGKVEEKDIQEWTATKVAKHKRLTGGVKVRRIQFARARVYANSE